jgi:hypothetical protein
MTAINRLSLCLLLPLGLMLAASPTHAQEVAAETDTGAVVVPVGPADALFISKTISALGPRTLLIHYFAECQVRRGHVEYDIVVNKGIVAITARQAAPTNDSLSALCSNDGATPESNLRAASVGAVVACTVNAAADYTVKVRGHVEGPGGMAEGLVDDQSLVIEQRPFAAGLPPCVNDLPFGT